MVRAGVAATLCMVLAFSTAAVACDSCGCSVVPFEVTSVTPGWSVGVGVQYTDFDRLQQDGQPVPNPDNQFVHSLITQVQVGYNFDNRVGLHLTLPYVSRDFQRVVGDSVHQAGNLSGMGDAILMGRWAAIRRTGHDHSVVAVLNAGLKLPTGSPDELQEQVNALLGGPDSVVGGHDLALGTGSLDVLLGGSLAWHRGAWVGGATVLYAFRNPGAFGYRYGNDFQWDVSFGHSLKGGAGGPSLSLDLNGETKNEDVFGGNQLVIDTGVNETFVGPKLETGVGNNQRATVEVTFPIHEANSDLQLVPSYRIRGSYVRRF